MSTGRLMNPLTCMVTDVEVPAYLDQEDIDTVVRIWEPYWDLELRIESATGEVPA